jgi:two-component system, OmpR family, sensor histidine kinase KdpD
VAASAVAATTVAIYPLRGIAPAVSAGVVYLVAVLLLSTYWGLWLGLITALASAATFNFFHIAPTGRLAIADPQHWVAVGTYLIAALIAATVADLARSRATEAERRRQEADVAADMARVLLGGETLHEALPIASALLAERFELPGAEIVLGDPDLDASRVGLPLDLGPGLNGALILPAGVSEPVRVRLRDRALPALGALLSAALERDALQEEVVEAAALRRSDVMKTALLRAVSHDLRSPLTAIIAAGDAVRLQTMDAGERDELGAIIVGEAGRLARLVEQLLDLSRLQAGVAPPRRDWCSIEEVVASAVDHLDASQPGVPVQIQIDRDLPFVRADAAQLERVFVNLFENARRYSGTHPVKVRARVVADRVVIRVIDRGPGIVPAELPHIFEPFRQARDGPEHTGSGLGLAIVRGFVEANDGRVRVESQPGQGSVFAIEFPLESQHVRHAAHSETT